MADAIPVLRLEGSPRERGEAHGEQARDLVRESAERWVEAAAAQLATSIDDYLDELIDGAGFIRTAQRLTPDLVEEVEGIADGSGVDHRHVLALNLMDEDWWMRGKVNERCTSFGVAPAAGQPAILGQNMDLRGMDGLLVLLDIRSDEAPAVLAPTSAGMVATNAFNERGVGVCVNTLYELARSREGLPVAFVIRALAASDDYEAAVTLLTSLPHASGQNYIVGSPTAVGCFEAGADGVVEYAPGPRIGHTNHPLVASVGPQGEQSIDFSSNSRARLEHVERRLAQPTIVDVEAAGEFLAESPLCRGGDGDLTGASTFYSMILQPDERRLWLSAGPPDRNVYERYDVPVGATF